MADEKQDQAAPSNGNAQRQTTTINRSQKLANGKRKKKKKGPKVTGAGTGRKSGPKPYPVQTFEEVAEAKGSSFINSVR